MTIITAQMGRSDSPKIWIYC